MNSIISAINWLVECLGPLQTVRIVVPGKGSYDGTKQPISALSDFEEYLRALSTENYLKEETSDFIVYQPWLKRNYSMMSC